MLVFMTDGLPTVGERNAEKIIANLAKEKRVDARIFPFGFGYDVNTLLLDKLGSENGGVSDYVQPKEDLEIKVSNFFTRVSSPVLSNVEIDLGGVEADLVYPRKPGDLFRGMQITMIGRYRNESDLRNVRLRLSGKTGSDTRSFTYEELSFPKETTANDFLPRLWATRRVGWLIEEIRVNGESKELKDEVVSLGTRYGIVTPYTSYLATDGSERGVGMGMGRPAASARVAMEARSGADAVQMSVQQNRMKANARLSPAREDEESILVRDTERNQFVANKNFLLKDGVWTDAEIATDSRLPMVKVKFGSEEYFELLTREPALGQYFALGEEVAVIYNEKIYQVEK